MNAPTLHLLLLFPFVFSEVGPLGQRVGESSPNEIIFQKIWDAWTIIIQETLRIVHEAVGEKGMMGRRLHMQVFTISPAHYNYLHFRGNYHNEPTKTKYYHKVVIFQQNCRSMILFPLVHENWWTSGGFSWWVDGSSDNKQKAFKSLIVRLVRLFCQPIPQACNFRHLRNIWCSHSSVLFSPVTGLISQPVQLGEPMTLSCNSNKVKIKLLEILLQALDFCAFKPPGQKAQMFKSSTQLDGGRIKYLLRHKTL